MILAVDIGNTNIVVGCCADGRILFSERVSTNHTATELEYAALLKTITDLHGLRTGRIDGAIISSVAPSVTTVMKRAITKITGADAMVIGPGIKTGLSIKIDNPAQLGSDLVVDAVAGIHEYGAPLIIIDMGTATTFSVIDSNKNYLGGIIMPGIGISLNAMVSNASQLPKIGFDKPKRLIGTNTVECMKSGVMYGSAAQIDGVIERVHDEIGAADTVATGGLAGAVVPLCKSKIALDDDLMLKGLMLIYDKNRRQI